MEPMGTYIISICPEIMHAATPVRVKYPLHKALGLNAPFQPWQGKQAAGLNTKVQSTKTPFLAAGIKLKCVAQRFWW